MSGAVKDVAEPAIKRASNAKRLLVVVADMIVDADDADAADDDALVDCQFEFLDYNKLSRLAAQASKMID